MNSKRKKFKDEWKRDLVLREDEVMDLFRFSKSTIARLRRAGILPYSKVGSTYFYQKSYLKEMLNNNMGK